MAPPPSVYSTTPPGRAAVSRARVLTPPAAAPSTAVKSGASTPTGSTIQSVPPSTTTVASRMAAGLSSSPASERMPKVCETRGAVAAVATSPMT